MPLFKVTNFGGKKRNLAVGSSLEELMSNACQKLKLPSDVTYKIVLEDDGTDIDDYDMLIMLKEAYTNAALQLMILPEDMDWEPVAKRPAIGNSPCTENQTSSILTSSVSSKVSTIVPLGSVSMPIIWEKLVPEGFEDSSKNSPALDNQFVRNLADYMKNSLKDTALKTAEHVARQTVNKFPKAFACKTWDDKSTDNSCTYSDGINILKMRIYDRVRYIMADKDIKKRKRISHQESEEAEDVRLENSKIKSESSKRFKLEQNEYGCVAYQPSLPYGESEESQMEKKEVLLKDFREGHLSEEQRKDLLNKTYSYQRIIINKRSNQDSQLSEILLLHWPHLMTLSYFLEHSSVLLGKNVLNIWNGNIEKKGTIIYDYFYYYSRKFKNINNRPKKSKDIEEEIKKASEACKNLNSKLPKTIAIFLMLSYHFGEKKLLTLVDLNSTNEVFEDDSSRPMLFVTGMSEYDESCKCKIVIEKQTVLEVDGILRGILIFLLTHYVYGYNYDPEKSSSLEFIQRMLLDVNPLKGHKRGRQRKGAQLREDTKVTRLINNIIKNEL